MLLPTLIHTPTTTAAGHRFDHDKTPATDAIVRCYARAPSLQPESFSAEPNTRDAN
jgi:hypothetical protein